MKFSLFLLSIFFFGLSSCIFLEDESPRGYAIPIEGLLGESKIRGVGVCIAEKSILTSAHVVPDDRYVYTASGFGLVFVSSRVPLYDMATLGIASGSCIPEKVAKTKPHVGERVFASVLRAGKISTLSGKVIEIEKQGIGYSEIAQAYPFISRVVTDISFFPGESGTPIFNENYELLDIAHTAP